jgi:hypothetical protein
MSTAEHGLRRQDHRVCTLKPRHDPCSYLHYENNLSVKESSASALGANTTVTMATYTRTRAFMLSAWC